MKLRAQLIKAAWKRRDGQKRPPWGVFGGIPKSQLNILLFLPSALFDGLFHFTPITSSWFPLLYSFVANHNLLLSHFYPSSHTHTHIYIVYIICMDPLIIQFRIIYLLTYICIYISTCRLIQKTSIYACEIDLTTSVLMVDDNGKYSKNYAKAYYKFDRHTHSLEWITFQDLMLKRNRR